MPDLAAAMDSNSAYLNIFQIGFKTVSSDARMRALWQHSGLPRPVWEHYQK